MPCAGPASVHATVSPTRAGWRRPAGGRYDRACPAIWPLRLSADCCSCSGDAGWQVSDGRVERLWRREGLKVPSKQPKKGRLWLNDGSCVRLRPGYRNHVWSYDFVHCRTDDGRAFRTLNILDEFSRECLAIRVKRKLNSTGVIDALNRPLHPARATRLHSQRQRPPQGELPQPSASPKRFEPGSKRSAPKTAFIEPGSPWENGYVESFNARLRDELLDGEIFYSLKEAQIIIEGWRKHYNTKRPHSALGYLRRSGKFGQ